VLCFDDSRANYVYLISSFLMSIRGSSLSIDGPTAWVAKSMLAVLSATFVLTTLYTPLFNLCAMMPSTVLTGPYSHVWTLVTAGWAEPDLLTGVCECVCVYTEASMLSFIHTHAHRRG
jgi:hypothetical protein